MLHWKVLQAHCTGRCFLNEQLHAVSWVYSSMRVVRVGSWLVQSTRDIRRHYVHVIKRNLSPVWGFGTCQLYVHMGESFAICVYIKCLGYVQM